MSDTNKVVVGEKGRVVIPAPIREQFGWAPGTELVVVETEHGIELTTAQQLLKSLRASFKGRYSVDEFLTEKHEEARREDELLGL